MDGAFILAIAALLSAPLTAVGAQESGPVSVEVTIGLGTGVTSGEYRDNAQGLTADALVAARVSFTERGSYVVAGAVSLHGAGPHNSDCILTSDGGCLSSFPNFETLSVLTGWQNATGSRRILTGPVAVRLYGDWDGVGFAWHTRVETATKLGSAFGVLLSLRALTIPSYQDDRFLLFSAAVGIRMGG